MVVVCSGSLKADSNKADSNVRVPPFELKMVNTSLCQICAGARIALPTGKFLSEKKHKLRCGLQWERKIRLLMWDENIYRYPSLSLALKFSIQRPQVSQANVCSLTCQRYISFETHSTCLYLVVCFVFVLGEMQTLTWKRRRTIESNVWMWERTEVLSHQLEFYFVIEMLCKILVFLAVLSFAHAEVSSIIVIIITIFYNRIWKL